MDKDIHVSPDYKYIPATSIMSGAGIEVLPDIYQYTNQIVNIQLVGQPNSKDFVLIDTGMPYGANKILAAVENRFRKDARPGAIILTHGHFDHVGGVIDLVKQWKIPVYAHKLELPYLTGDKSYPLPDATVEGGMIAKVSPIFPNEPIDLGDNVIPLPDDGSIPHLPAFRWLHTPGHSPGHISIFRDSDRTLIAGDAFVTVKQEYLYKVLTQQQEISGPPRYLTTDWEAAKRSVTKLLQLQPKVAVTGHGLPLTGEHLQTSLQYLVENFEQIAKPDYGKFLH